MKTAPPDDWLNKYSGEHLLHELKMFWWVHGHIPPEDQDPFQHDAAIECFVLHLRNLIDFFYPRESVRPDDVVATDFMDDPKNWSGRASTTLEAARGRSDKELSHLTDKRKDEGDATKPWEVGALFAEIRDVATDFAGKASQKKLHRDVRELLTAMGKRQVEVLAEHAHSTNAAVTVVGPVSYSTGTSKNPFKTP
jgi:hypothetical protein